jgi:hypothetical protein
VKVSSVGAEQAFRFARYSLADGPAYFARTANGSALPPPPAISISPKPLVIEKQTVHVAGFVAFAVTETIFAAPEALAVTGPGAPVTVTQTVDPGAIEGGKPVTFMVRFAGSNAELTPQVFPILRGERFGFLLM